MSPFRTQTCTELLAWLLRVCCFSFGRGSADRPECAGIIIIISAGIIIIIKQRSSGGKQSLGMWRQWPNITLDPLCEIRSCHLTRRVHTTCRCAGLQTVPTDSFFFRVRKPSIRARRARLTDVIGDLIQMCHRHCHCATVPCHCTLWQPSRPACT